MQQQRAAALRAAYAKKPTIALDKVKPPAIKADSVPEPLQPVCEVLAHSFLAVIQVGGCNVVLLGFVATSTAKGGIVITDVGLVRS